MQYFGGKAKVAKHIVSYLEGIRKENQIFLEPFNGGYNIGSKMSGERIQSDYNEYLIELYKAMQSGYNPPNIISEEQYKYIKENKDEDKVLTGFVGFGCSFSGKWFGGYARSNSRNYCSNAKNSLIKKFKDTDDKVKFVWSDYKDLNPNGMLIYCDPPYKGTVQPYGVGCFNTEEFWDKMREWSKDNDVYISEYEAPNDFECVLEINTKTDIRNKENKMDNRVERLFKLKELT